METTNALKFETNPYHNILCKDRKYLELSGVKLIESFDVNEFILETSQGWMSVRGKDLTLAKLDTEHGDVIIKGLIETIEYLMNRKSSEKESLLTRLFK